MQQPRAPKRSEVAKAFAELWSDLFSTPIHLDSALSKRAKHLKSPLAGMIQPLLLRPVTLSQGLGIGLPQGEPWSLSEEDLTDWPPAREIAERLFASHAPKASSGIKDFPPEMIEEWTAAFGRPIARELSVQLGQDPPTFLRAKRGLTPDELIDRLGKDRFAQIRMEPSRFSPVGVRLSGYAPVLNTEAFTEGSFEIQDEGSQVMSLFALWPERFEALLSKTPGAQRKPPVIQPLPEDPPAWTVVDACAGAGGKSLALADALGGKGRVFAYDTSATKLQALRKRATRAGLNNIQTVTITDGKEDETVKKFRRRANVVLVDAPCTGWGVLRRNPDIKWRQDREVLAKMPPLQQRLLSSYSDLVAPGGRLVFGVCTFRPEETVRIVESFTESHPDFTPGPGGYFGPGSSDGFFMQCWQRKR